MSAAFHLPNVSSMQKQKNHYKNLKVRCLKTVKGDTPRKHCVMGYHHILKNPV